MGIDYNLALTFFSSSLHTWDSIFNVLNLDLDYTGNIWLVNLMAS